MASLDLIPTLKRREHPLASPARQREVLAGLPGPGFDEHLAASGLAPLAAGGIEVLQINVGKRCNQTCRHCHVDAGPDRPEEMPDAVVDACLRLLETSGIPTLDITGGAPELHPRFREVVRRGRGLGRRVIDRCNLTIVLLPAWEDLPGFLAALAVEVVASLPSLSPRQTDAQRGGGVFEASLEALRRFNACGYGRDGSGLLLHLVTNPAGAFLPGDQAALERDWKRELKRRFGIEFNRLYTLTNMPISRYLDWLVASGNLEAYIERLTRDFNPATVDAVMCRSMLSVGWDGRLYDCDFNQMLETPLPFTIFEASAGALAGRPILTGRHCFGCTAGAGST